ncbi:MAG: hypothetical protein QXS85_04390 [Acidilobaceae archaeon]
MPQSGRGALRASEAIAASYLESLGFRVVDFRRKVVVGGVEVSDVDLVAEKGGESYAVEVKSGAVDVDAVRQAYVNAKVLGMKPAVVGRGLADERALALARELGVELYLLSDLLVASANELRDIVYEAVYSALSEALGFLASCMEVGGEDERVLRALASSTTISEAAEKLSVTERELAELISALVEKGVLPRGSFKTLVAASRAIVFCRSGLRQVKPVA